MSQEEWADATGQAQDGESRQIVGQEGWLRAEAVSRLARLVFQQRLSAGSLAFLWVAQRHQTPAVEPCP